jgi:hypothetical protein
MTSKCDLQLILTTLLLLVSGMILADVPAGSAGDPDLEPPGSELETAKEEDIEESKEAADRFRFLPIPIFVTEPAVGKGLGVALAVFHPVKGGSGDLPPATTPTSIAQLDNEQEAPPVVSAAFGAYTDSKTWMAGVGHFNNFLRAGFACCLQYGRRITLPGCQISPRQK